MARLELNNVSISNPLSRDQFLVNEVSFTVDNGEILAIIGPNGAGKSSLLKAITGDLPHNGRIVIEGESKNPKLRARQIAVLPQFSYLNFPYRVCEVVNLARIPHESGIERDNQIIDEALEIMDIGFLKNRVYTELSGGEKQRVQLARVIAQIWDEKDAENQTRLLILDEPTTALDIGHQRDLMNVIKTFSTQGVSVVMVLHDINLAAQYADKVLALLCSNTLAYGTNQQVITKPIIEQLFSTQVDIIKHPKTGSPTIIGI